MRGRENKHDEYSVKRVYDPAEQSDGYRVLVDRLGLVVSKKPI